MGGDDDDICSLFAHHHPLVTCSGGSPRHTARRQLQAERLASQAEIPQRAPVSHQRELLSREPGPILAQKNWGWCRREGGMLRRNICWLGRAHLNFKTWTENERT